MLIQRLAIIIALLYVLSPFQQHIGNLLHSVSHNLSLPDYVITHSQGYSGETLNVHQYGDHRTDEIIHEHQFIDFVQTLLEDSTDKGQQSEPFVPDKTIDKHLVVFSYTQEVEIDFKQKGIPDIPVNSILNGHSDLWSEPPIS